MYIILIFSYYYDVNKFIYVVWGYAFERLYISSNRTGLAHTETTMYALVEIIHAFLISDQSDATLDMATGFYLDLLLCDDTVISFSSKMATIAVLKPRMIQKKVAVPSSVHVSSSTKVTRKYSS